VPALVVRREERADVAEPCRSEHGICERVRDHVAVGVTCEAARELDRDTAEDEPDALFESVCVDPEADPKVAHPSGS
jgi:hypothetical protein